MSVIQTKIEGGSSKPTSNGGTLFRVKLGTGQEPSTFDTAVYRKAVDLHNQMADVELEQKGQYLNIINVGPPGTLGGVVTPSEAQMGQDAPPAFGSAQNGSGEPTEQFQRRQHPDVARKLSMTSALEIAFSFGEANQLNLEPIFELADQIFEKINGGSSNEVQVLQELNNMEARVVPAEGRQW